MHYVTVALLSSILMLSILIDVLRFPLLRKDRGSRFFSELTITYSLYIILTLLLVSAHQGLVIYPVLIHRLVWTLHALAIPFLLSAWMHFNAVNVMDDPKLVGILSLIHDIPLAVLTVLAFRDVPRQQFYPLNQAFVHLLPSSGNTYIIALSWFFCFAMLMPTLGHRKNLQGSFLFISLLLPLCFGVSLISLQTTHSPLMFMLVNAFMLVLYYLIGQRDSVTFDSLSGLPNEALLQRKLIRIFRFQSPHTLIFLDIENFEYFSSLHGAPAAEQVLVGIGTFLKTMAASNEAFRLEGSRFCLCLPSKGGRLAHSVVQAVRQRMTQGWQVEGELLFVQVNFGVLHIPSHASTLAEYDQARKRVLSEITSVRKQPVFIFTKQDAFDQQRRMNVLSALRSSIRNPEQVMVHYQPIHDVATGRMVSAEALMRIKDEHLGFLPPSQFISLAEQSGLIVHLTKILLSKVCTLVRKNLGECALEYISVNLSGEDFNSSHIAGSLISIIEQEQIAPKKIGFEITESVALRSYEKVSQVMLELSLRDIKFALDDFGTGYSNLKALMDLPYAYVKFDKSVIHAAMADPAMLALLVDMLHTLGKVLIAEGVETEQQLEMVKSVGIERVQGFYYAKPMEEQAFLEMVG